MDASFAKPSNIKQDISEDIIENLKMDKYYEEIFEKNTEKYFKVSLAPPKKVLRESKEWKIPKMNNLEKLFCQFALSRFARATFCPINTLPNSYSKVECSDQSKKSSKRSNPG